jgi:cell division protein FtsN
LGSYDNRAAAEQKSAQILSSYVAEVQVNGMNFYRVYFGDFENPVIAIEAMNRLKGLGHEGFIKQINK